jgi:hypothetical protein
MCHDAPPRAMSGRRGEDNMADSYLPNITGRLWVIPDVDDAEMRVWIGGDPEGLRSFGELLIQLAEADQEARQVPRGEHEHDHLFPKRDFGLSGQLGAGSCPVEVCRADASGTGEFYPHLLAAEEAAFGFTPDTTSPVEWLAGATASLQLAQVVFAGSGAARGLVSALVARTVFCALMSGLRSLGVEVPDSVDHLTQLTFFVPDDLELPFPVDVLDDLLMTETVHLVAARREVQTDEEAGRALEQAKTMIAWATQRLSST